MIEKTSVSSTISASNAPPPPLAKMPCSTSYSEVHAEEVEPRAAGAQQPEQRGRPVAAQGDEREDAGDAEPQVGEREGVLELVVGRRCSLAIQSRWVNQSDQYARSSTIATTSIASMVRRTGVRGGSSRSVVLPLLSVTVWQCSEGRRRRRAPHDHEQDQEHRPDRADQPGHEARPSPARRRRGGRRTRGSPAWPGGRRSSPGCRAAARTRTARRCRAPGWWSPCRELGGSAGTSRVGRLSRWRRVACEAVSGPRAVR